MRRVRKAVITAAGRGTRQYPASSTVQKEMFPLVDRDGLTKPTIQIIAEEALASGIEELCIVTAPGDEEQYRRHFSGLAGDVLPAFGSREWALRESAQLAEIERRLTYVIQESPEGYGHAVYCSREFVGDEPFLLLLGDHVYVSAEQIDGEEVRCSRQVLQVFEREGTTVSAVKRTPEDMLHLFGTVQGRPLDAPRLYEVAAIREKPTPDYADEHLRTPGLRRGEYLCFFGMQVFTPSIFDCLEHLIRSDVRERGEFQLTSAQALLRDRERYLAYEALGDRYDMGVPYGYVETQIALALHSPARDQMLASIVKLIARSGIRQTAL
jgi:UTP--glucose-1-phosphate uridylyltransferase